MPFKCNQDYILLTLELLFMKPLPFFLKLTYKCSIFLVVLLLIIIFYINYCCRNTCSNKIRISQNN